MYSFTLYYTVKLYNTCNIYVTHIVFSAVDMKYIRSQHKHTGNTIYMAESMCIAFETTAIVKYEILKT